MSSRTNGLIRRSQKHRKRSTFLSLVSSDRAAVLVGWNANPPCDILGFQKIPATNSSHCLPIVQVPDAAWGSRVEVYRRAMDGSDISATSVSTHLMQTIRDQKRIHTNERESSYTTSWFREISGIYSGIQFREFSIFRIMFWTRMDCTLWETRSGSAVSSGGALGSSLVRLLLVFGSLLACPFLGVEWTFESVTRFPNCPYLLRLRGICWDIRFPKLNLCFFIGGGLNLHLVIGGGRTGTSGAGFSNALVKIQENPEVGVEETSHIQACEGSSWAFARVSVKFQFSEQLGFTCANSQWCFQKVWEDIVFVDHFIVDVWIHLWAFRF